MRFKPGRLVAARSSAKQRTAYLHCQAVREAQGTRILSRRRSASPEKRFFRLQVDKRRSDQDRQHHSLQLYGYLSRSGLGASGEALQQASFKSHNSAEVPADAFSREFSQKLEGRETLAASLHSSDSARKDAPLGELANQVEKALLAHFTRHAPRGRGNAPELHFLRRRRRRIYARGGEGAGPYLRQQGAASEFENSHEKTDP